MQALRERGGEVFFDALLTHWLRNPSLPLMCTSIEVNVHFFYSRWVAEKGKLSVQRQT